jgi:hypothetical protein
MLSVGGWRGKSQCDDNSCNEVLKVKIDRLTLVTFKMANKRVVGLEGVINNVVITIMRVSTIVDIHMVLEEDGAYSMILGRPWLTKSHARNYWGKRYMTIGIHPN